MLQVSDPGRCVTLEQSKGERAALVKGVHGDWALVKAQWVELQRGVPPHKTGQSGSDIQVRGKEVKLRMKSRETRSGPKKSNQVTFHRLQVKNEVDFNQKDHVQNKLGSEQASC